MKNMAPDVDAAISALFWSIVRIETIFRTLPAPELSDPTDTELREMLQAAGKEALDVAYNSFETLDEYGVGNRDRAAFEKLKEGSLKLKRMAT